MVQPFDLTYPPRRMEELLRRISRLAEAGGAHVAIDTVVESTGNAVVLVSLADGRSATVTFTVIDSGMAIGASVSRNKSIIRTIPPRRAAATGRVEEILSQIIKDLSRDLSVP